MSETPTFGRYAEVPYEKMTPEQQEGYKAMIEARGRLPGPTKIWVHNPKLAKVAGPFGAHFQPGHYSLTEREREIAVCVITSRWHSAYPTAAHERHAKEVGLPAAPHLDGAAAEDSFLPHPLPQRSATLGRTSATSCVTRARTAVPPYAGSPRATSRGATSRTG